MGAIAEDMDDWNHTVQRLCDSSTLCCFSSCHKQIADLDARALDIIFGAAILQGPDLNPFGSKLPNPDPIYMDGVYYSNKYITAFKGYKSGHMLTRNRKRKPEEISGTPIAIN